MVEEEDSEDREEESEPEEPLKRAVRSDYKKLRD